MVDTSQVDDGVYKVTLLWTAVHEIGVGDLDWSRKAMVRGDVLGTFCGLLGIWRGEGFGLLMAVSDNLSKVGDLLFSYNSIFLANSIRH